MKTIEVSDENYDSLINRQTEYKMLTINDVITKLLKDTEGELAKEIASAVLENTRTLDKAHKVDKVKSNQKSDRIKEGFLWQHLAKVLPNYPYSFGEVFDIYGSKFSPIDAIAFPGLDNDNITEVHLIDYQFSKYVNGDTHKAQVKKCVKSGNILFRPIRPLDLGIKL
jgi:predicted Holliday junction resolvase-like endonuclease